MSPPNSRKTFFNNYDYGGSDKPSRTSPGRGLFNGKMNKYKSIKDFLKKKRSEALSEIDKWATRFYLLNNK